jgi:hypothetical protein
LIEEVINYAKANNLNFTYYPSRNRIDMENGSRFYFYRFEYDKDLMKLRGPNFDAVIVSGNPSEDFITYSNFANRLGDNPIRIHV